MKDECTECGLLYVHAHNCSITLKSDLDKLIKDMLPPYYKMTVYDLQKQVIQLAQLIQAMIK